MLICVCFIIGFWWLGVRNPMMWREMNAWRKIRTIVDVCCAIWWRCRMSFSPPPGCLKIKSERPLVFPFSATTSSFILPFFLLHSLIRFCFQPSLRCDAKTLGGCRGNERNWVTCGGVCAQLYWRPRQRTEGWCRFYNKYSLTIWCLQRFVAGWGNRWKWKE